MDKQIFEKQYSYLKEIFEEVDPAGVGTKDENDDLIFKIVKKNKDVTNKELFAHNIAHIIGNQYELKEEDSIDSSKTIASRFLGLYPNGL